MKCLNPNCGFDNPDGVSFCVRCGWPLPAETVEGGDVVVPEPPVQPDVTPQVPTNGQVPPTQVSPQPMPSSVTTGAMAPATHGRRVLAIVLAVAACAVAAAIVVVWVRPGASGGSSSGVDTSAATSGGGGDLGGTGNINAVTPATPSAGGGQGSSPVVRASLSDYSWDELADIATLVEAASDRAAALQVAARYNLVGADGRFTNSTKALDLTDGTSLNMLLVGVWHDDLVSGGKAGLSFLSTNLVGKHRAADATTTNGGWAASELRSYLTGEILPLLPQDLGGRLVTVTKLTNNAGKTYSTSDVTGTADLLWAPSVKEVAGNVDWSYTTDPTNSSVYNAVFNAEGSQYQYFSQAGIVNDEANVALAFGDTWWLRSPGPSTGRGRYVGTNGDPSLFGNSNDTRGVVVGFCL